ncbi:DUF4376 domain-containing protein [Agrobacterium pusense]|uniref:XkdW family protein n=1 Tax=Agrobacterium pusense TaxID=648995 RepID=UPI0022B8B53A|nr:DUF4376 domain-containing protein [Agrobacterium pusense]MCZ7927317.1 DUF4376 domain-containing protein [Agrobacterium pusense]
MSDPYSTEGLPYDLSSDDLSFLIRKLHPTAIHGVDFWCAHKVKPNSPERTSTAIIVKWDLAAERPNPAEIEALAATYAAELVALRGVSALDVDIERDRRVEAGFVFDGVLYQSRPEDRENIAGAVKAATDAVALGAAPGDFGWQRLLDPNAPPEFRWIAADNTTQVMDAQTVMRFGYAALGHKQAHILAARELKNMNPIPADFATEPAYWP